MKLPLRAPLGVLLLVLLRLALDASRWLSDPGRYWNWEEAYNTGVAWYVGHAGLADRALELQYKAFCGGCTVVAAVGAPLLVAGGDHLVVWKSLALGWTAATLVAGFLAFDALVGRAGAWAFLLLAAVPPLGWSDASLMLWGNHQESALVVLLALLAGARGRHLAAGLLAGVAVWFCRTSLYAVPVVIALGWARGERAKWRGPLGLLLGLLLVLVPAGAGDWGSYRMSPAANLFPGGIGGAVDRLRLLMGPPELAVRLYATVAGMDLVAGVWLVAVLLGAGLALRGRARAVVAMAALFLALFASAGFPVPEMRTQGPVVNLRYHAPWFFLGAALVAAGAGVSWGRGGARRVLAGLAVAGMMGANAGGWGRVLPSTTLPRDPWGIPAVSHLRFAWMATWRLDPTRLAAAHADDPLTEHWLRRMDGFQRAAEARRRGVGWAEVLPELPGDAAVEGFAQALTDPFAAWSEAATTQAALAELDEPTRRAFGRGMSANLAFGVTGGGPPLPGTRPPVGDPRSPASVQARRDDLLRLLGGEAGCPACAAAGAAVMDACRAGPDPAQWGACLVESLGADSEVAFGAGRACLRPAESPAGCLAAGRQLGLTGDSAPFEAGVNDPAAGMDRPFVLPLR